MIDRRFMTVFFIVFALSSLSTVIVWHFFSTDRASCRDFDGKESNSCAYEEIDLVMPIAAFLKRCANSPVHSYVRRLFVNQWISSNQADLVALVVFAQGATTYDELKKALLVGIEKKGSKTGAASFILGGIKVIDENQKLIEHINKSLIEGYDISIHTLRGQMMGLDTDSIEYKKLKGQYRKQLEQWIDDKHGELLDEIIAHL